MNDIIDPIRNARNVESSVSSMFAFFIIPDIIPMKNIVGRIIVASPVYSDVGTIITIVKRRLFPLNMFFISIFTSPILGK